MSNTPKSIPFTEQETGVLAGLWWVPESGFKWVNDLHSFLEPEGESAGPWLVTASPQEQTWIRRYPVLKRPKLLDAFFDLSQGPSPDAILQFANRWGCLGEEDSMAGATGRLVSAEPLGRWISELLHFRHLYETWQAIVVRDVEHAYPNDEVRRAGRLLADRIHWSADASRVVYEADVEFPPGSLPFAHMPRHQTHELIAGLGIRNTEHLLANWRPRDAVEPARYYVHKKVNDRLAGNVNLAVLPLLDGRMRFFPKNLLAAVYVHFAFRLAGAGPQQRECEFCRQLFPVRRRDQRFCGKNCREAAGYHRRKLRGVGVSARDTG
jgi:hypothetical protein